MEERNLSAEDLAKIRQDVENANKVPAHGVVRALAELGQRVPFLVADLESALRDVARLLEVLRAVEWGAKGGVDGCMDACPECGGWKPYVTERGTVLEGHNRGCRIAAVLQAAPPEKRNEGCDACTGKVRGPGGNYVSVLGEEDKRGTVSEIGPDTFDVCIDGWWTLCERHKQAVLSMLPRE